MNEPRERVFFTDRDLGRRFPARLLESGLRVERHDDHFDSQTPDTTWTAEVGRRGWVAVSRDARIRYSPLALNVLMASRARLFVLVGKLTAGEAADLFLRSREEIEDLLRKESQPFIAKIRRDGVHIWLRHENWKKFTAT